MIVFAGDWSFGIVIPSEARNLLFCFRLQRLDPINPIPDTLFAGCPVNVLVINIPPMSDAKTIGARFAGVELYFTDLKRARDFYSSVLGLPIIDEDEKRYAKFGGGACFVCLERKGSESYPSYDKAVLFFEVPDLRAAIRDLGEDRFVQREDTWAVVHDPEGHNILLLQR